MVLFVDVLDVNCGRRQFNCELTTLEDQFDILNHIVSKGHTLLSAYVVDETIRMDLPVAAFDGLPMSKTVQALEQEWQSILSGSSLFFLLHNKELIKLLRRRIAGYESNIADYKRMVGWFNSCLYNTQINIFTVQNARLIQAYKCQLIAYQTQLDRVQLRFHLAINRLNILLRQEI